MKQNAKEVTEMQWHLKSCQKWRNFFVYLGDGGEWSRGEETVSEIGKLRCNFSTSSEIKIMEKNAEL